MAEPKRLCLCFSRTISRLPTRGTVHQITLMGYRVFDPATFNIMGARANSGARSAENWPVRSALREPRLMTHFVGLAKIQNNCPRNHSHLSPLIVFLLYFPKFATKKGTNLHTCEAYNHGNGNDLFFGKSDSWT